MKIDSVINSPKYQDNSVETWLPQSRVSDFTMDVSLHKTMGHFPTHFHMNTKKGKKLNQFFLSGNTQK